MSTIYTIAPEVAAVAAPLIREYHNHLLENNIKVLFFFSDQAEKDRGKEALGVARKEGGRSALMYAVAQAERQGDRTLEVAEFFSITVWEYAWRKQLTPEQRTALVDHELCHLFSEEEERDGEPTGKIILKIIPHDLEAFFTDARRHGLWAPNMKAFLDAAKQGPQLRLYDHDREAA